MRVLYNVYLCQYVVLDLPVMLIHFNNCEKQKTQNFASKMNKYNRKKKCLYYYNAWTRYLIEGLGREKKGGGGKCNMVKENNLM